jgi:CO/xanthine dehydrogenase Mo-binding subunit
VREQLPGVKAVITARDVVDFPLDQSVMLGIQDMRWMCRNVMAREKALFLGHPVAAVAAIGATVQTNATPEEFTAYIKSEYNRWGEVIRAANIKVE